jgi:hypothetical protein
LNASLQTTLVETGCPSLMAGAGSAGASYETEMDIPVTPSAVRGTTSTARLTDLLRVDGFLLGLVAAIAAALTARLTFAISQDTWVSLLAGRTIVRSGLPHHDTLTYWSRGKTWVDQQWLAHLASYGLYEVGGLVLLGLCSVALVVAALGGGVVFVRRSGVGARTVAWLLALSAYAILIGAGSVRTQVLAFPLFVTLLALLLTDARRPSRRVFAALPLLVLWANLHGSVTVGVGLVLLRSVTGLRDPALRLRSVALALGALVAGLATPYGAAIVGYYHHTLLNPSFGSLVTEWRPLSLTTATAPVIVLAAGALWLTARHTRLLGLFAVIAQLVLIALPFVAVRNIVWLGFGSLLILGPAFEAEIGNRRRSNGRMNALLGVAGAVFLVVAVVASVSQGPARLTRFFPTPGGDAVADAAARQPSALVYSDERFSDWLMFRYPKLVGHVAYDVRFEQLTSQQLLSTVQWKSQITDHWRLAARGAHVIVVALPRGRALQRTLLRDSRLRQTHADAQLAVFVRR